MALCSFYLRLFQAHKEKCDLFKLICGFAKLHRNKCKW